MEVIEASFKSLTEKEQTARGNKKSLHFLTPLAERPDMQNVHGNLMAAETIHLIL